MAQQKIPTISLADCNKFNAIDRGVYIADNLDFLRSINTASVDLVCIDPPFAKNNTFTGDKLTPPLSQDERENEFRLLKEWGIENDEQADEAGIAWPDDPKARGGYEDTWSWDEDIHPDWVKGIKATHPAVNMLIETTQQIHGDSISAYLAFMAIRLFEIHRILKPTGSLYLHCDHTASGYLRQLLDGIFGKENFRNEIIWCYPPGGAGPKYGFHRKHETIYYYGKTEAGQFNRPYGEMPPETAATYKKVDEAGRHYKEYPGGRQYLDETPGRPHPDWWIDIVSLGQAVSSKERTGYPTQKPMALAERIIKASTNPGDVILDCFAGCAYVALAAEKLAAEDLSQKREWAACDLNPRAWTVFKRQFNKGGKLPILACNDATTGQQVLGSEPPITIHGPHQLPDLKTTNAVEVKKLRTQNRRAAGSKYRGGVKETTLMSRLEMLTALLKLSQGRAWCCGAQFLGDDKQLILTQYELDHITPKSRGGEDEITNRAPLCKTHNILKSDRDINLDQLRYEVIWFRQLADGMTPEKLVDLEEALREARYIYEAAYQRKHGVALI